MLSQRRSSKGDKHHVSMRASNFLARTPVTEIGKLIDAPSDVRPQYDFRNLILFLIQPQGCHPSMVYSIENEEGDHIVLHEIRKVYANHAFAMSVCGRGQKPLLQSAFGALDHHQMSSRLPLALCTRNVHTTLACHRWRIALLGFLHFERGRGGHEVRCCMQPRAFRARTP